MRGLKLADMVRSAEEILIARAISRQSLYDEFGRIVTDVELEVESAEKGECRPGELVLVRHLGGVVDGIGMKVAGAATFPLGERTVLFASRDDRNAVLRPLAMSQGVLPIEVREGIDWVLPSRGDVLTVAKNAAGKLQPAAPALRRAQRLDGLLKEIRSLIGGRNHTP